MCWSPAPHSLTSGTFTITHTIDFYCLGLQGLHGVQPIRLSSLTATAFWEHASPPPPSINRCLQAFANQNKQLEKLDCVMNLYGSGAVRGMKRAETQNKRVDWVQVHVILQFILIYKTQCYWLCAISNISDTLLSSYWFWPSKLNNIGWIINGNSFVYLQKLNL